MFDALRDLGLLGAAHSLSLLIVQEYLRVEYPVIPAWALRLAMVAVAVSSAFLGFPIAWRWVQVPVELSQLEVLGIAVCCGLVSIGATRPLHGLYGLVKDDLINGLKSKISEWSQK